MRAPFERGDDLIVKAVKFFAGALFLIFTPLIKKLIGQPQAT